jgi:hypothetical protein
MSAADTRAQKHGRQHRISRQVRAYSCCYFLSAMMLTGRRRAKAIEHELYKRADGGAACAELAAALQE